MKFTLAELDGYLAAKNPMPIDKKYGCDAKVVPTDDVNDDNAVLYMFVNCDGEAIPAEDIQEAATQNQRNAEKQQSIFDEAASSVNPLTETVVPVQIETPVPPAPPVVPVQAEVPVPVVTVQAETPATPAAPATPVAPKK